MDLEHLSIDNVCSGGVPEIFERELREILKNIADVNTDPETTRKIVFEFVFEPFDDRSGATIRFRCKSRLAPVEEVTGQCFLQRRGTEFVAVPRDPKQARLFAQSATESDKDKGLQ